MLRRENIRFDERLKKLKDPGDALKRKAHFGNGLSRSVGLAPVGGNGGKEIRSRVVRKERSRGKKRKRRRSCWTGGRNS